MSRTIDPYAMPSAITMVNESGRRSRGGYGAVNVVTRESIVVRLTRGIFKSLGYVILGLVFVGILGVVTYTISYAADSPTIATLRTQEIPSDGIVRNTAPAKERSMEVLSP